jgi:hypothetical protein
MLTADEAKTFEVSETSKVSMAEHKTGVPTCP